MLRRTRRRFATRIRRNPPNLRFGLRRACARRDSRGRMASASRNTAPRRPSAGRRIVVVAVPPVDELDLVGPLQVFRSVNRLAGRPLYAIEIVTNRERPTIEGEGGVLTFLARHHFRKVKGRCDSVLLV